MKITAKVRCNSRAENDGQAAVLFGADYFTEDGKEINAEWAKYTPALSISMNVLDSVQFEPGKSYTLTFDDGEA